MMDTTISLRSTKQRSSWPRAISNWRASGSARRLENICSKLSALRGCAPRDDRSGRRFFADRAECIGRSSADEPILCRRSGGQPGLPCNYAGSPHIVVGEQPVVGLELVRGLHQPARHVEIVGVLDQFPWSPPRCGVDLADLLERRAISAGSSAANRFLQDRDGLLRMRMQVGERLVEPPGRSSGTPTCASRRCPARAITICRPNGIALGGSPSVRWR